MRSRYLKVAHCNNAVGEEIDEEPSGRAQKEEEEEEDIPRQVRVGDGSQIALDRQSVSPAGTIAPAQIDVSRNRDGLYCRTEIFRVRYNLSYRVLAHFPGARRRVATVENTKGCPFAI